MVAAALGFGGLVFGLSRFGAEGVLGPLLIVLAGLMSIGVFLARQRQLQRAGSVPLMDLRVLRVRTFALSLALMSVAFMAMLGSMILLPLYLQNVRLLSPLETGLLVMPGGLAMGLLGPTVGRTFDRFGARVLVIPGSAGIVASLSVFTQVSADMPYWQILAGHVVLMVSLASVFTPVFTVGLGSLPLELYSYGSSMLGTLQQVAAAFGTALVVTVMSIRAVALEESGLDPTEALIGGMRLAFLVGAVLSIAVVAIALRLPARVSPQVPDHEDVDAGEQAEGVSPSSAS